MCTCMCVCVCVAAASLPSHFSPEPEQLVPVGQVNRWVWMCSRDNSRLICWELNHGFLVFVLMPH